MGTHSYVNQLEYRGWMPRVWHTQDPTADDVALREPECRPWTMASGPPSLSQNAWALVFGVESEGFLSQLPWPRSHVLLRNCRAWPRAPRARLMPGFMVMTH